MCACTKGGLCTHACLYIVSTLRVVSHRAWLRTVSSCSQVTGLRANRALTVRVPSARALTAHVPLACAVLSPCLPHDFITSAVMQFCSLSRRANLSRQPLVQSSQSSRCRLPLSLSVTCPHRWMPCGEHPRPLPWLFKGPFLFIFFHSPFPSSIFHLKKKEREGEFRDRKRVIKGEKEKKSFFNLFEDL